MAQRIHRGCCRSLIQATLLLSLGIYVLLNSGNYTGNNNYDIPVLHKQRIFQKACPSTRNLFYGGQSIEGAIKDATQWHKGGWNLKSLQLYLDNQISSTIVMNDIYFVRNGQNEQQIHGKDVEIFIKDYFNANAQARAGYGKILPGKLQKTVNLRGTGGVWEDRFIEVDEPWSFERWNASLGPIGPICKNITKLGSGYEAKYFCDWELSNGSKLKSSTHDMEECHIFSIGSNDQWGFETDLLSLSNCTIHTFDCTLKGGTAKNKPKSDRVVFYNFCIGLRNETFNGRQYAPYSELWGKTGAKNAPKLVKMDVEGFEYDVIIGILEEYRNGHLPEELLPEQIIVELHWATKMVDLPWLLRTRGAAEISLFLGILFSAGYMPVYSHFDSGCVPCLEVLFVRVLCSA